MRQIPAKIWVPVMAVILAAVSLAVILNLPKEEKAPEVVSPEETPEEEITPPEGIVWNVPAGQVDPRITREIQRAVYGDKFLNSLAKEYREEFNWNLSIENLAIEGNWADLDVAPRDLATGQLVGTEGLPLLAQKINDQWEVVGPADEKFFEWLPQVPDSLISPETKEFLIQWYQGVE